MKVYDLDQTTIEILKKSPIFEGIPKEKYNNVLNCLNASTHSFQKRETILNIGDYSKMAGIVISGMIELVYYDENGNQININHISDSQIFGADRACSKQHQSTIELRALTDCKIIFLDFERLLDVDSSAPVCPHKARVTTNLLMVFADQNQFLNQKMRVLSQKKLRDKIKVYLQTLPMDSKNAITLPFNRQELADYLYVDRSALSRELSRMSDENLISIRKSKITILNDDFFQ